MKLQQRCKSCNEKLYPGDTFCRNCGDENNEYTFVLTPQLSWLEEKSYEKMYLKGYDYGYSSVMSEGKRVSVNFKNKLAGTSIEDRLDLLYRKFKLFNTNFIGHEAEKTAILKTIKTNTYRVKNILQIKYNNDEFVKIKGHLPVLCIYVFTDNEIIENVISYHKQFTHLKNVEFTKVDNFKKFVQSLNLTDWKSKYMRGIEDGFIAHNDSVIIFNKYGEKKNGNAYISKLIFTNKE